MDEFKSVDIKGCLAKARDLFLRAEFAVKKYERIGLESQIGAITEYRCCWARWALWLQFWERLLAFFARIIATDARLRCPST